MSLVETLRAAGFRGEGLRTAWAIAMRESGGNPKAFNGNTGTGDRSWGLFQINTLGPLQARIQQYGLRSERDLLDPMTNAKVAFRMSGGGKDFGPWGLGPNAYKGAPAQAKARYEELLPQFPGGGQGGESGNDAASRTAAAFQQGPAGIVAGPNPLDELAFRKTAAMTMLDVARQAVSGGGVAAAGQALLGLSLAKRQLQQAQTRAIGSEQEAQAYGGTTAPGGVSFQTGNGQLDKALQIAGAQIGKPYVWGAESPAEGGFDCSGLIDYAFKQAGIKIPGRLTTQTAARMGQSVRGLPYQPGDWLITNGGQHMVMYVGGGKVIAAPRRGTVVQYQPVSRFDGDIVDVRRVTK